MPIDSNNPEDTAYTYLLECADGSLYAGWTLDLLRRLDKHNDGTGAKYTRARGPVRLLKAWEFPERRAAMRFEAWLKGRTRAQKLALVAEMLPSAIVLDYGGNFVDENALLTRSAQAKAALKAKKPAPSD